MRIGNSVFYLADDAKRLIASSLTRLILTRAAKPRARTTRPRRPPRYGLGDLASTRWGGITYGRGKQNGFNQRQVCGGSVQMVVTMWSPIGRSRNGNRVPIERP